MNITPARPVPLGHPTPADQQRACDRLSIIHGRPVTRGHAVDQLAWEYAQAYAAGYEAAQRHHQAAAIPAPRAGKP